MKVGEGRTRASLENAGIFLRAHRNEIGAAAGPAIQALDELLADTMAYESSQTQHAIAASGAVNRVKELRIVLLRDYVAPLVRIAKVQLPHAPGLVVVKLPPQRSPQILAGIAAGMANAAEPYVDVFIAAGLKPDFFRQMKLVAGELHVAATVRKENRVKVRTATTDLRERLARGRQVVYMIDAIVQSALAGKAGLLDGWKMAKRVGRGGGGSVVTEPPTLDIETTTTPDAASAAA